MCALRTLGLNFAPLPGTDKHGKHGPACMHAVTDVRVRVYGRFHAECTEHKLSLRRLLCLFSFSHPISRDSQRTAGLITTPGGRSLTSRDGRSREEVAERERERERVSWRMKGPERRDSGFVSLLFTLSNRHTANKISRALKYLQP